MIRISIIITLYKSEQYIAKCLDSVLNQDLPLEEYEIIVINDGSPDNSHQIALAYAGKYDNIVVVSHENKGLGGARNTGVEYAKGKYVQFVDPDDFLEPNVLIPLLDKMDEGDLDILRFNYQNVNEEYKIIQPYKYPKYNDDYSDTITNGITFLTERLGYACYVWQFIFKAGILIREGNRFKQGVYIEDTEWTPRILVQVERITSVDAIIYNYLLRNDSITTIAGKEKQIKVIGDILSSIESIEDLSGKYSDNGIKAWGRRMIAQLCISVLKYAKTNLPEEIPFVIKELRKKKHFPLSMRKLPPNQKRNVAIINLSPKLFCRLVR
jgi:glycosyltransferase involved in cell wall biosynthesis